MMIYPALLPFRGHRFRGHRWDGHESASSDEQPRSRFIFGFDTLPTYNFLCRGVASYNKTYGSLGAVIAFMVWMWLSIVVILIGAELDAEMEKTVQDTTVGQPKPLGARGATMADTVGAAQD
jgi:hypothetical protein